MEKICFAYRRLIARTGIACALGLSAPVFVPHTSAQESVVQKELNRRINNARKAHDLLKSGDVFYQKSDYAKAVRDYAKAFDLLPPGAMAQQLHQAAADRYATAATERARLLAKRGDYPQARKLLNTVLSPEVAPAHIGALKMLGQLEDPIRYNHALTPAHAKNIHKVGLLLREAEGFHSLGQYNRAHTVYHEVLRIDPFNKTARRGMEKIAATKADYFRSSQDQGRAAILAEVARQWERPAEPSTTSMPAAPGITGNESPAPDIRQKLAGIVVENVSLDNARLEEAIDFVRAQSRIGDIPDASGEQAGVNIIINLGHPDNEQVKGIRSARVNIKGRSLPLSRVIDYIADQTHTQWRTDGVAVIITPRGSTDTTLITRRFRVPPNFLSSSAVKKGGAEDSAPFSDDADDQEGKMAQKISIKDFLKQNGVSFPEGSSAVYTESTNTLLVKNTPANIETIEQVVSLVTDEEPVMVVVKTTIMRVSESRLKELSFDWILTPWAFGRQGLSMGGGSIGNGTGLFGLPTAPVTSPPASPVTSGLRSGSGAIPPTRIDTLIGSLSSGTPFSDRTRAPGILTLTGIYSGVQVQMMMRGLDNKKGVDVMAKPSTIARSGERAKIEIIREFIYPTEYEPPEIPNFAGGPDSQQLGDGTIFPVTPAMPSSFETRNVGITLEVEPTVGPNKRYIDLSLKPEMVEFEGFINYGSPIQGSFFDAAGDLESVVLSTNAILLPIFKTTRLQTSTVTIQDGATIVLGGVRTMRKTKIEDKVPLLGDLPLAGRLFRSNAENTYREAVIIMVTAELIDPTGKPWRKR